MKYLFIIDHAHLDDGRFLKDLARKISEANLPPSLFIHGDSAYTDRIMQQGVMREPARIRATRELNNRLTALFADEGVPLVAVNGHQKGTLVLGVDGSLTYNAAWLRQVKGDVHRLVSSLAGDGKGGAVYLPLHIMAMGLSEHFGIKELIAFGKEETPSGIMVSNGTGNPVCPDDLVEISDRLRLLNMSMIFNGKALKDKLEKG